MGSIEWRRSHELLSFHNHESTEQRSALASRVFTESKGAPRRGSWRRKSRKADLCESTDWERKHKCLEQLYEEKAKRCKNCAKSTCQSKRASDKRRACFNPQRTILELGLYANIT